MEKQVKTFVKTKGRSLLFRIIFSRTMITLLLMLLQIWSVVAFFLWLKPYSTQVYIASVLLSALLIIYVTNANIKTEFKLVWMLPLCAFPLFGHEICSHTVTLRQPGNLGKPRRNGYGQRHRIRTAPA